VSDTFLHAEAFYEMRFDDLVLPDRGPPHTTLLDLDPLPKTALKNEKFEALYPRFSHFNPIQTQVSCGRGADASNPPFACARALASPPPLGGGARRLWGVARLAGDGIIATLLIRVPRGRELQRFYAFF